MTTFEFSHPADFSLVYQNWQDAEKALESCTKLLVELWLETKDKRIATVLGEEGGVMIKDIFYSPQKLLDESK